MKMKHLAGTIAGLVLANSANAIELHSDATSNLILGGWIGMEYSHNFDDSPYEAGFNSGASRIFLTGTHKVADNFSMYGKLEYALAFSDKDDMEFNTRLGYIGAQTEFGTIEAGKLWSTFYDIAQYSDTGIGNLKDAATGAFYAPASEVGGFGRADNALKYTNAFTVGQGKVLVGALVGEQNDTKINTKVSINATYGGSLRYAQAGLQFGVAYQGANAEGLSNNEDRIDATIVGAMYNSKSFLVGGNYTIANNNQNENAMNGGNLVDSKAIEAFAHYRFDSSLKTYLGYNQLDTDSDNHEVDYFTLGLVKNFNKKAAIYAEYRIDNGTAENSYFYGDTLAIGMQYYFSDYPQYW